MNKSKFMEILDTIDKWGTYFALGVILLVIITKLLGCGGAIQTETEIADGIVGLDTAAHILQIQSKTTDILDYVSALHRTGIDKKVLEKLHHHIDQAHKLAKEEASR